MLESYQKIARSAALVAGAGGVCEFYSFRVRALALHYPSRG